MTGIVNAAPLKETLLSPDEPGNTPLSSSSNLMFLAQVSEKVAAVQLQSPLNDGDLSEKLHSGFSPGSTEASLLKACSDLLLAVDPGSYSILLL